MSFRQFKRRITLATIFGLVAVLATAAVAYAVVERVRIGSEEFDRALLFNNVVLDTTAPPGTLSESFLLNISLLTSTPEQVEQSVLLLHTSEDAYLASVSKWKQELTVEGTPDALAAKALLQEMSAPADEFWRLTNDVVVPTVQSGDAATAMDTIFGPMQAAFSQHHDVSDRILTDVVASQTRQEARTTSYIEHQRNLAVAFVVIVCAGLVIAGCLLRRATKRTASPSTDDVSPPLQPEPTFADANLG